MLASWQILFSWNSHVIQAKTIRIFFSEFLWMLGERSHVPAPHQHTEIKDELGTVGGERDWERETKTKRDRDRESNSQYVLKPFIHTYLAREIWLRRWFSQGEAYPLHSVCADPCDFPKHGKLNCIICGSGGLCSSSPLDKNNNNNNKTNKQTNKPNP